MSPSTVALRTPCCPQHSDIGGSLLSLHSDIGDSLVSPTNKNGAREKEQAEFLTQPVLVSVAQAKIPKQEW